MGQSKQEGKQQGVRQDSTNVAAPKLQARLGAGGRRHPCCDKAAMHAPAHLVAHQLLVPARQLGVVPVLACRRGGGGGGGKACVSELRTAGKASGLAGVLLYCPAHGGSVMLHSCPTLPCFTRAMPCPPCHAMPCHARHAMLCHGTHHHHPSQPAQHPPMDSCSSPVRSLWVSV